MPSPALVLRRMLSCWVPHMLSCIWPCANFHNGQSASTGLHIMTEGCASHAQPGPFHEERGRAAVLRMHWHINASSCVAPASQALAELTVRSRAAPYAQSGHGHAQHVQVAGSLQRDKRALLWTCRNSCAAPATNPYRVSDRAAGLHPTPSLDSAMRSAAELLGPSQAPSAAPSRQPSRHSSMVETAPRLPRHACRAGGHRVPKAVQLQLSKQCKQAVRCAHVCITLWLWLHARHAHCTGHCPCFQGLWRFQRAWGGECFRIYNHVPACRLAVPGHGGF